MKVNERQGEILVKKLVKGLKKIYSTLERIEKEDKKLLIINKKVLFT